MVRVTSARPSGGREAVPAKTTSSILPPRRLLAPCSPITQANASTMFDLPDPFGPTTQVIPGSNRSVVAEAKDLNPRRVRLFTYTRGLSSRPHRPKTRLATAVGVRGLGPPGQHCGPWRSRLTPASSLACHGCHVWEALGRPAFPGTLPRVDDGSGDSRAVGRACRAANRGVTRA